MQALRILGQFLASLFRPEKITFGQMLKLVIPSLLIAFLLRFSLTIALPEGYFGSDSNSYYEFSHKLFDDGIFRLNEKRRWLYPIFLAFLDWLPIPGWYLVPLCQHVIGLLTLVGIGWCSAQLVIRPRLVVPIVTFIAAIWPRMLWYEHEFIAESLLLAAFVAVISLLLTPGIVSSRSGLIVLMLAFVLLAGMKGSGRFLWTGSVLGLFLIHHDPRRWLWGKISFFLAALSVLFVSTIGKNSQGDWLALSSTLPLVRLEGEPYSRYREALKDQIIESRLYGDDYPWAMKIYKKRLNKRSPDIVHPDWAELNRNNDQFSRVARSFWLEAVLRHPRRFAGMTLKTMLIASSSPLISQRLEPSTYWHDLKLSVSGRWQKNPTHFNRLFGINKEAFELRHQQGRHRPFLFLSSMRWVDQHLRWWGRRPLAFCSGSTCGKFPEFTPRPLGVMAALGVVSGVAFTRQRLQCLVLLFPLILYLSATYAVGDSVSRYLHPVEWIGFVFVGVFFDYVFQAGVMIYTSIRG